MLRGFPEHWPNLEPLLMQLDRQLDRQEIPLKTLAQISGVDPATISRFKRERSGKREISLGAALCIGGSLGFDATYISVLYTRDELIKLARNLEEEIRSEDSQLSTNETKLGMLRRRLLHIDSQRKALDASLSWMDPFGPSRPPVGEGDTGMLGAISLFKDERRGSSESEGEALPKPMQQRRLALQRLLKRYKTKLKMPTLDINLAAKHISLSSGPAAEAKRDKLRSEIRAYGIGPLSRSDEELRGWLSSLAALVQESRIEGVTEGSLLDEFKDLLRELRFADYIEGGASLEERKTLFNTPIEGLSEESWLSFEGGKDGRAVKTNEGRFFVPTDRELLYQRTRTLFRGIEIEFFRAKCKRFDPEKPGVRIIGNSSKGLELSIVVEGGGILYLMESGREQFGAEKPNVSSLNPKQNVRQYQMIKGDVIVFPANRAHRYEFLGEKGLIVSVNIKASINLSHLLGMRTSNESEEFTLG